MNSKDADKTKSILVIRKYRFNNNHYNKKQGEKKC